MRLDGRLDSREQIAMLADGSVVGYAQAAWHRGSELSGDGHWAIEVAVAPQHRDGAATTELIEALRVDLNSEDTVLWARVGYVADAAIGGGWERWRVLWEMRRRLPVENLDPAITGFRLASFRMGIDETAWLEANNATFAGHPENGDMTRRDLEKRMAEPWFDPDGFVLAWDGDQLAGSCWTKVHENGVGEIYIVGVVPRWEGRGLGRALVSIGLEYLANQRHSREAMLFVESANRRAVRLYRGLGFDIAHSVEAYRYRGGADH
jgi:mycothiol synthase